MHNLYIRYAFLGNKKRTSLSEPVKSVRPSSSPPSPSLSSSPSSSLKLPLSLKGSVSKPQRQLQEFRDGGATNGEGEGVRLGVDSDDNYNYSTKSLPLSEEGVSPTSASSPVNNAGFIPSFLEAGRQPRARR